MRKRVLLIDDEPDIREVAIASLELTKGWEVVGAESGIDGIRAAKADQPDAVVLDVMMPEMDGPETFRRLKSDRDTHDIPVVLMTAKVQASERDSLVALGVDGLIAKPFDPMTLGDHLADLLGWHTA